MFCKLLIVLDFTYARKIIIEMIIETDMARHFSTLTKFRQNAFQENFTLDKIENKLTVLAMCIKCSDIGHSSKQ